MNQHCYVCVWRPPTIQLTQGLTVSVLHHFPHLSLLANIQLQFLTFQTFMRIDYQFEKLLTAMQKL